MNGAQRHTGDLGAATNILPVVRLRGLPFQSGAEDIINFLGVAPVDIVFVSSQGRPSGEAFVVLAQMDHMETALEKHQEYMGKRYVEVYRCRKIDYYKAIYALMSEQIAGSRPMPAFAPYPPMPAAMRPMGPAGYIPKHHAPPMQAPSPGGPSQRRAPTGILKLRGLPFTCTAQQIVDWFADVRLPQPIPLDRIHLVSRRGRSTGIAYVEFDNPEHAEMCMRKNREVMGMRYIELFIAQRSEMERDIENY